MQTLLQPLAARQPAQPCMAKRAAPFEPVSLRCFQPACLRGAPSRAHRTAAPAPGSSGCRASRPLQPRVRRSSHAVGAWRDGEGGRPPGGEPAPASGALLSPQLPSDVRKRAGDAIAARDYRVTVGDVAAAAGLSLLEAEQATQALAADAAATLQVSSGGEIVYVFPRGFRESLAARSLALRLEPALAATGAALSYLARVAFGTALIASVVVVATALAAIASGGRSDDRRRDGGGGGYYYGGGPRVYFDLTDLLWYWDPWYYRHRRARLQQGGGMGFLEAIFSFVFGDGDPNADYDARRWQALGRHIQSRGGVVAAEEMAPFLDPRPSQLAPDRGERVAVDEGYVLPALVRLRGSAEVGPAGQILYRFPELQATGGKAARGAAPGGEAALEARWQLSEASPGQQLAAAALGALNLVGVAWLSLALASPANQLALLRSGVAWVAGAMPFLQAYAAAFFAVPLVRWLRQRAANAALDGRNAARRSAAALLRRPDPTLAAKLEAARRAADLRVVTERDVVYRTDRDLDSQPGGGSQAGRNPELDDFDRKLRRREEERRREQGGGRQ